MILTIIKIIIFIIQIIVFLILIILIITKIIIFIRQILIFFIRQIIIFFISILVIIRQTIIFLISILLIIIKKNIFNTNNYILILIILIITIIIIFIRQIVIFFISILLIIRQIIIFFYINSFNYNNNNNNICNTNNYIQKSKTQEPWILTPNPKELDPDAELNAWLYRPQALRFAHPRWWVFKPAYLGLLPGVYVWPQRLGPSSPSTMCLQPGAMARLVGMAALTPRAQQHSTRYLQPRACNPTQTRTDHFLPNQKDNPTPLQSLQFSVVRVDL